MMRLETVQRRFSSIRTIILYLKRSDLTEI
jgi:hypothetical protein